MNTRSGKKLLPSVEWRRNACFALRQENIKDPIFDVLFNNPNDKYHNVIWQWIRPGFIKYTDNTFFYVELDLERNQICLFRQPNINEICAFELRKDPKGLMFHKRLNFKQFANFLESGLWAPARIILDEKNQ